MPRILILDTYYPDFLKSIYINPAESYATSLQRVMEQSFGTFDAYSYNLKALGWDVMDVIANSDDLQTRWAFENGVDPSDVLRKQIEAFNPDVIFLQDLNIELPKTSALIAAQHSCPWAGDEKVRRCAVVFTSFPHYVERIERLGVKAVFNPLAFDPIVLDRLPPLGVLRTDHHLSDEQIKQFMDAWEKVNSEPAPAKMGLVLMGGLEYTPSERPYDCVFIGGVGAPSHWKAGMEVLEAVARTIPSFKWWGYGYETLHPHSALRDKYQGTAFGLDMYRILAQAKVCLNRHGEVAQGYSNNMRCFEATGMGALLVTEKSLNLSDYFNPTECVTYGSPEEAVYSIREALKNDAVREEIARNGQARTLRDHTYLKRMEKVSEVLKGMLCAAYP